MRLANARQAACGRPFSRDLLGVWPAVDRHEVGSYAGPGGGAIDRVRPVTGVVEVLLVQAERRAPVTGPGAVAGPGGKSAFRWGALRPALFPPPGRAPRAAGRAGRRAARPRGGGRGSGPGGGRGAPADRPGPPASGGAGRSRYGLPLTVDGGART